MMWKGDGIHVWRWRALAIWCIAFTMLVAWAVRENRQAVVVIRHAVAQLNQTKADITSLKKTNCGLRGFLLNARAARIKQARLDKGAEKINDMRAAHGYLVLADNFTKDNCR